MTHRNHFVKHGKSNTAIYKVWENMKQRCLNVSHKDYHHYGGRGINICDSWLDFENFYADMGDKPKDLSLDRINNDLGYSPENCRWADYRTQLTNQRLRKDNKTGYKKIGKYNGKYEVRIRHGSKVEFAGRFTNIQDAVAKRDEVNKILGDFFGDSK